MVVAGVELALADPVQPVRTENRGDTLARLVKVVGMKQRVGGQRDRSGIRHDSLQGRGPTEANTRYMRLHIFLRLDEGFFVFRIIGVLRG